MQDNGSVVLQNLVLSVEWFPWEIFAALTLKTERCNDHTHRDAHTNTTDTQPFTSVSVSLSYFEMVIEPNIENHKYIS